MIFFADRINAGEHIKKKKAEKRNQNFTSFLSFAAKLPNAATRPWEMVRYQQKLKKKGIPSTRLKISHGDFGVLAFVIEWIAGKNKSYLLHCDVHGCRWQFSWSCPLENACRHLSASIPCSYSDKDLPGKVSKIQTLNIRWTIQNVAKVTWGKGSSICHWDLQTETLISPQEIVAHVRSCLWKLLGDWEIPALQEKQTNYQ